VDPDRLVDVQLMSGRRFLQVPGPSNVPQRVRQAMDCAVIDHRGSELPAITAEIVDRLRGVFGTRDAEIVLIPGSGTAGWEASLVNTLSPGDRVIAFDLGFFSHGYADCARAVGLEVLELAVDWGESVPHEALVAALEADVDHQVRGVLVVHNETSTGVMSRIEAIRQALDRTGHPALLFVDAVSSLASTEFEFDRWRVDVAVTGAQKGLMLPPGMGILAISERALEASLRGGAPRYFLDWRPMIEQIHAGYFPYTPATLLLFGLREALRMLDEEGLPAVYERHRRLAAATRAAVGAWNLEVLCHDPDTYSPSVTAVAVPEGADADAVLQAADQRYQLSLGTGLARLKGRVFRIGHLGSLNELELLGALAGTELALDAAGIAVELGAGVAAAQHSLLA
jgi:alanine-glyoxylate transaminase/serine-glyoxylate transaminase/serine-pyruvate transaminase